MADGMLCCCYFMIIFLIDLKIPLPAHDQWVFKIINFSCLLRRVPLRDVFDNRMRRAEQAAGGLEAQVEK